MEPKAAQSGDYSEVHAALQPCAADAYSGAGKQTVLMLRECTPELARWLVERGADLEATDTSGRTALHHSNFASAFAKELRWEHPLPAVLIELGADVHARDNRGQTPLHAAAAGQRLHGARALIAAGADVDARDDSERTPLEHGLWQLRNIDLEAMLPVVDTLIEAGATVSTAAQASMRTAAETFEFHRSEFLADDVEATAAAMTEMCALIGVDPPAPRQLHDGTSPIVATQTSWQDRHVELWDLLVPSNGPAATVQGELIRISGRLGDEIRRNGGGNWDDDHRSMADAFTEWIASGTSLDSELVAESAKLTKQLPVTDTTARLCELATMWVARNPEPVELPPPAYSR